MKKTFYLHDWEGSNEREILSAFGANSDALGDNGRILVASYTYEDYYGMAYVLFEKDGKLFEVHGSHCSCYGLYDEQWEPEETTKEAILHRVLNGTWGIDDIGKALISVLENR